jgi:hypothetical protein
MSKIKALINKTPIPTIAKSRTVQVTFVQIILAIIFTVNPAFEGVLDELIAVTVAAGLPAQLRFLLEDAILAWKTGQRAPKYGARFDDNVHG